MTAQSQSKSDSHHPPAGGSFGLAGYSPPLLRPKSRPRWVEFVALNLLLFVAANVFWEYLRSGQWLDFSLAAFHRGLSPAMGEQMLHPLSILTHPWMMIVFAVLLAVLIAVPLTVAVMYQLLLSLGFVLVVAVVGHSPLFALALAAGCLVSARTRLRREYPFFAAALGMIPVCVYLYVAYLSADASLGPLQQWVLAGPFVLAVLGALLAAGTAVGMARLTRFQPGVLWPALVVLLPVGAGLFYAFVGTDELHYALLREQQGLFATRDRDHWAGTYGRGLSEPALRSRIQADLDARKKRLFQPCDTFLSRYPDSPCAPSVAWMRAYYPSMQIDSEALQRGDIRFEADFPLPASADPWRALLDRYPESPPAAIAQCRLGLLTLRRVADIRLDHADLRKRHEALLRQQALVSQAHNLLRDARTRLARVTDELQAGSESTPAVFLPRKLLPPSEHYRRAWTDAAEVLWVMERNQVLLEGLSEWSSLGDPPSPPDPLWRQEAPAKWKAARDALAAFTKQVDALTRLARNAQVLARLLGENPFEPEYGMRVRALAENPAVAKLAMADNLRLAAAKLLRDLDRRAEALLEIAADERTDAAIEAIYELAGIAEQTKRVENLPEALQKKLKPHREYLELLVAAPPNPWQGGAEQALRRLGPAAPISQPPASPE